MSTTVNFLGLGGNSTNNEDDSKVFQPEQETVPTPPVPANTPTTTSATTPPSQEQEEEKIPDVTLKSVQQLPESLAGLSFEEVRKALYHKYHLMVRDDETYPDLYMIAYEKKERNNSLPKLSDEDQVVVDQFRGVIVKKKSHRPLCYTFDRMSRHLADDIDLSTCKVTESVDGSQIKIFFSTQYNKWIVSTTRRINAAKAFFFTQRSFLDLFQDVIPSPEWWDTLNKKCCYSFVLSHPESRVVARHKQAKLTHVLTRNMETMEIVMDDIGVPRPSTITFKKRADIWKNLKKLPFYKEGYVVQSPSTCHQYVKIVNKKYQDVKNLRGSSSSLLYHFFDLRKRGKVNDFLHYYPEFRETFSSFEDSYYNLCCLVYNEYVLLRVRKVIEPDKVLRFLKQALYQVHGLHLGSHKRIHLHDVQAHLDTLSPYILRHLVESANGLPYSFL